MNAVLLLLLQDQQNMRTHVETTAFAGRGLLVTFFSTLICTEEGVKNTVSFE